MPDSSPHISVVLPAYNAEKYLDQAVGSILAQTFTDFELIIVDDGSIDKTLAIAHNLANDLADPRIRVIANKENCGIPKTRNIGWKAATGEFIAHQDADDYSHPTRLEKQIAYLLKNPKVGILGTNRQTINRKGKIRDHKPMPEQAVFDDLLHRNLVVHGSALIRRSVLEQAGGYDEWFLICEDYDLWLRIADKIAWVRNLPDALYVHREHDDSMTAKDPRPTELYRMAALNNIKGNLTEKMREEVMTNGIESYEAHLSAAEQLELTKFLASAYKKTKNYGKALAEYKKLAAKNGMSWKIRRNILLMKWRAE